MDSVEEVTHALRTTEYLDRDDQYMWFLDALGMRKPHIYSYSRFNLQNTVLSKRKLTWFVDSGKVRGWDDPRFPTVRGILRRGMTVEALKQFIVAQGSSRSVVQMDWDKIWAINKKFVDEYAPRHTALIKDQSVLINVTGLAAGDETKQVNKHPKNDKVGLKNVLYSSRIRVDHVDALDIKDNDMVTLMDWGNAKITKVHKSADGKQVTSIDAELHLDNKDFKKTLKVTWLADASTFTPIKCYHFDHIIAKPVLDKDEDFKLYCNHQTEFEFDLLGDSNMRSLVKGDIVQISRRGFYIVDVAYDEASGQPLVLFNIPEGNKNEAPTTYMSISGQRYPTKIFEEEMAAKAAAAAAAAASTAVKENKCPVAAPTKSAALSQADLARATQLSKAIKEQGEVVKGLKTQKAAKELVDADVKKLLALKNDFKQLSGLDWSADVVLVEKKTDATATATATASNPKADQLSAQIKQVGDKIRQLKSDKAAKVK